MPDYELVLWDKQRFDVNSVPFVKEACDARKWAFAADYIRLYAIFTEGGIYLDTDVIARKRFDDFLEYGFFTSIEANPAKKYTRGALQYARQTGLSINPVRANLIQAAVLGGVKGHPFARDCMAWYEKQHFILEGGKCASDYLLAPDVYTCIANRYGFRNKDERQVLKANTLIFPSCVFSANRNFQDKNTYAIHWWFGSWRKTGVVRHLVRGIKNSSIFRKIFHLPELKTFDEVIKDAAGNVS